MFILCGGCLNFLRGFHAYYSIALLQNALLGRVLHSQRTITITPVASFVSELLCNFHTSVPHAHKWITNISFTVVMCNRI